LRGDGGRTDREGAKRFEENEEAVVQEEGKEEEEEEEEGEGEGKEEE